MRTFRPDARALIAAALLATPITIASAPARAQTPEAPNAARPAAGDLGQRTQALIDAFVGVMPRNPLDLLQPDTRAALAPKALPVLRRIRAHVALHPECAIAGRVHEFTVYALALDDAPLRDTLTALARDGDGEAEVLLRAADVIVAAAGDARARAVEACARALAALPPPADAAPAPSVAACAAYCMVVAASLSPAEARQLADGSTDAKTRQQLADAAYRAERDARQFLDKPFALDGTALDGAPFTTGSLRGKVVLVDFWASWCGPCVKALPELVRLRREIGADRLAIVGVSCDHDRQKLTDFLAQHADVDWPQLFAGASWHPLATEFGVGSIPRLFLIDRRGVLRSVDAAKQLDELVRRYLAE